MIGSQKKEFFPYSFVFYEEGYNFQKAVEIVAEDYYTAYRTFRSTHANVRLWSVVKKVKE